MSDNVTVQCTATIPLGLVRIICGAKFREGEREGNTGQKPDETIVGCKLILEGPSNLIMPTCWVLYKASNPGATADFHFRYALRETDISVKMAAEDLMNGIGWLEKHGVLCQPVAKGIQAQA